jgi:NAD(P)-dependent dehydrogenase (short-subunit alcohol dehydrogenase family)
VLCIWACRSQTNVYSVVWLCQAALAHLPRDGVIINTTSINAFKGHPTLYVHCLCVPVCVCVCTGVSVYVYICIYVCRPLCVCMCVYTRAWLALWLPT